MIPYDIISLLVGVGAAFALLWIPLYYNERESERTKPLKLSFLVTVFGIGLWILVTLVVVGVWALLTLVISS